MEGWIKLHRSFLDHWLCDEYRPLTKREAWETMLFTVNYEDKKVLLNGSLVDCKRGQSLLSIESWAKKFVWSIGQVRHFFKLLENDEMIITEGLKYTTRLTICNYDKYQDAQQTDDKLTTISQQTDDKLTTTTKERIKKDKKDKKDKIYTSELISLNESCKKYFEEKYINESSLETFDQLFRIDGYSINDIKQAILNGKNDTFWKDQFQSPRKLRTKDKSGVLYIDKFLSLKKQSTVPYNYIPS